MNFNNDLIEAKLFKLIPLLFATMLSIIFTSCGVPISQSTVQLSTDVGTRITEMESLHQLAVQRYFDLEVQKIEDFLTETWEPLFLKNFLGTSQVLNKLNQASQIDATSRNQLQIAIAEYLTDPSEAEEATNILVDTLSQSRRNEDGLVRAVVSKYVADNKVDAAVIQITSLLGTDDPALIIFEFAEAAHNEMNKQRQTLLAPIQQARNETTAQLGEAYSQLLNGQSTITGRLAAAAKVTAEQDKILGSLGLKQITTKIEDKLSSITSGVDSAISSVNAIASQVSGGDPSNIISTLEKKLQDINTSN